MILLVFSADFTDSEDADARTLSHEAGLGRLCAGRAQAKVEKRLEEMQLITYLRIPRRLKPDVDVNDFTTELHLFADASELAYGAACYVRLKYIDGTIKVSFLLGKSRLAPIKVVTIPRLELCAAVLAAKMHESILSDLNTT